MLLGSVLGVYAFSRWMQSEAHAGGKRSRFWPCRAAVVAWAGVTLAVLLKLPALYLGLPLLGLAIERHGAAAFRRGSLWLFAGAVVVPVALWYWHAHQLLLHGGVTFEIWGFGTDKWGNFGLLGSPSFYNDVFFKSIAERHLTWAGFVPFVVGLCLPRRDRKEALFDWWLLAVLVYILIVARGNQVHEYYQLPIMLPAAVFAGKAFARYWPSERAAFAARPFVRGLFPLLLVGFCVLSGLRLRVLWGREDSASPLFHLAATVQDTTTPGALVVAVSEGNPIVLYRCDRKGWNSSPDDLTPSFLAEKQRRGARYVVGEKSYFRGDARRARLQELLRTTDVIVDDPDYFVARLLP